jgi:hypothetical protein
MLFPQKLLEKLARIAALDLLVGRLPADQLAVFIQILGIAFFCETVKRFLPHFTGILQ